MKTSEVLKRHLPDCTSIYGAPMGRRDWHQAGDITGKVHCVRVPINSGGYDRGGAYWGRGDPLYLFFWFDEEGEEFREFRRAKSRDDAKKRFLAHSAEAKFYR